MTTFQKALPYFSLLALLLTAPHCASVPLSPIKLSCKWDESFDQGIKCVYLKVGADLSRKDEAMYASIIKGFKKSLLQKGIVVREDFTWDSPETTLDSTIECLQPDVWLVLGRTYQDLNRLANPSSMSYGNGINPSQSQGVMLLGGLLNSTIHSQRLFIQMVNPNSKQDLWVGEVSFHRDDAKLISTRVVRQWKAAGLLGSTVPEK